MTNMRLDFNKLSTIFQFPLKGDVICSGRKAVIESTLLNTTCSNWSGLYPSILVSF
jgi:hypothetical protein